jgi:glyceraldehyde-3-phosphate dehydrogenase/erythrose-4-phosphate dehydrogenase
MKKIKVGIAGFGIVGKRRKDCIDRHPSLQVTAVCDQTFDGEGELENNIRYYQDYQQLLEAADNRIRLRRPLL